MYFTSAPEELSDDERLSLGHSARQFLGTPIGRWMTEHVGAIINENLIKLKDVDPDDRKEISELQDNIRNAERFIEWLNDAMNMADEVVNRRDGEDDIITEG
jgi:hypothetical protein